ncbi:MAG: hypothetical protein Q7J27_10565 [Syntrophales bacterium]|nr:hypothetical protein [Syntrophales bacterium]
MTAREKEIFEVVEKLGGIAHPTKIGKEMGISADYAEQLCRDMVWQSKFIKHGLKFAIKAG